MRLRYSAGMIWSVSTSLRSTGSAVHGVRPGRGGHPDRPSVGQVVDDGVVDEVRRQLLQEGGRAERGGGVARGLDGGAAALGLGEEGLGGVLGQQGQVDAAAREGALVGAAEQEERLGEPGRPGVDVVEAVEQLGVVVGRVPPGDVEEGLGDGQRGAPRARRWPRSVAVRPPGPRAGRSSCRTSRRARELVIAPSSRIRCEREPLVASRVASVIRARGASIRPARNQPPTTAMTSRAARAWAARGTKASTRSPRKG